LGEHLATDAAEYTETSMKVTFQTVHLGSKLNLNSKFHQERPSINAVKISLVKMALFLRHR
jgi:hypothetical protein